MSFGGGGGGGTETVETEVRPWGPAVPSLIRGLEEATEQFQNYRPAPPMSTVAPFNPYQQASLEGLAARGAAGSPLVPGAQQAVYQQMMGVPNPTFPFLGGAMSGMGGVAPAMPYAYGDLTAAQAFPFSQAPANIAGAFGQSVIPAAQADITRAQRYPSRVFPATQGALGQAQAYGDVTIPQAAQDVYRAGRYGTNVLPKAFGDVQKAREQNPALTPTSATVGGAYLGSNPFLSGMFGAATEDITRAYMEATAPSTQAAFTASGGLRGAGPAYQQAVARNEAELADALGRTAQNIYGQAYGQERAFQEAAMGRQADIWNQQIGNRLAATGQLGGMYQDFLGGNLAASAAQRAAYDQPIQSQLAASSLMGQQFGDYLGAGRGATAGLGDAYSRYLQGTLGATGQEQGAYSDYMRNRLAATGQLGSLGQTGLGQQLQAAQQFGGLWGQDLSRQLQAASMAPGLAEADYTDLMRLGQAGDVYQQQRERELAAAREQQQWGEVGPGGPYGALDRFLGQVTPVAGLGQYQQGQTAAGGSPITAGLGGGITGGLAGAGIAQELFGLTPFSGPWGWALPAAGGLLGLAGGIFGGG